MGLETSPARQKINSRFYLKNIALFRPITPVILSAVQNPQSSYHENMLLNRIFCSKALVLASCIFIWLQPQVVSASQFDAGVDAYSAGDYKKALKFWVPLADRGNAAAQYNVGIIYFDGKGVPRDVKKAFKWLRIASHQKHKKAQNKLAAMYASGIGIDQDYVKAFQWYQKAAGLGLAEAQFNLGEMYYHGKGVEKSEVEAKKWWLKASRQQWPNAKLRLTGKKPTKIVKKQAAPPVETPAVNAPALSNTSSAPLPAIIPAPTVVLKKSAINLNPDEPMQQYILGRKYFSGKGLKKDIKQAFKWWKKSAELDNPAAQYSLAMLYFSGRGVKQNDAAAFQWLTRSAASGYAIAQNNLGIMFEYGRGTEKNFALALRWYERAADSGHQRAQFNLGTMYHHGRGVKRNINKAKEWYQKAAKNGHGGAVKVLRKLQ